MALWLRGRPFCSGRASLTGTRVKSGHGSRLLPLSVRGSGTQVDKDTVYTGTESGQIHTLIGVQISVFPCCVNLSKLLSLSEPSVLICTTGI